MLTEWQDLADLKTFSDFKRPMSLRVVFLDRDGTINVDYGYVVTPEKWEFLPGVPAAIRSLREAGYAIAVVTNQSAVASGRCTIEDVERLHEFMSAKLASEGAIVDAVAFCPHSASEGCDCRKPKTGMLRQLERQLGTSIDLGRSWTIGDKPSDTEFGRALGTRTVLLTSRYWNSAELTAKPDYICSSLVEAVKVITNRQDK